MKHLALQVGLVLYHAQSGRPVYHGATYKAKFRSAARVFRYLVLRYNIKGNTAAKGLKGAVTVIRYILINTAVVNYQPLSSAVYIHPTPNRQKVSVAGLV